jgi:hypothetical protein
MRPVRFLSGILLCTWSLACAGKQGPSLTPDEEGEIAAVVAGLFDEIADATNALEFDRLLGYYSEGDDLALCAMQPRLARCRRESPGATYAPSSVWRMRFGDRDHQVRIGGPREHCVSAAIGRWLGREPLEHRRIRDHQHEV